MAKKFYRQDGNFYEEGTNRYIGSTEFGKGENFTEVKSPASLQNTLKPDYTLPDNTAPASAMANFKAALDLATEVAQRNKPKVSDVLMQFMTDSGGKGVINPAVAGGVIQEAGQRGTADVTRLYSTALNTIKTLEENKTRQNENVNSLMSSLAQLGLLNQITGKEYDQIMQTGVLPVETLQKINQAAAEKRQPIPSISEQLSAAEKGYEIEGGQITRDISGATAAQIAATIKQIESGGDYNIRGKSGEFGAYQFMPDTWYQWSREYRQATGAVPSGTPENQDAVALFKIQQWQNQGYSPEQIASLWNSGSPDATGKVGKTARGVSYNVPAYVERFKTALSQQAAPVDEFSQFAQEQIALSVIPSTLKNSDVELKRLLTGIRTGLSQGKTAYEIADNLMGYQISEPDEFSNAMRQYISIGDLTSQQISEMARLINGGKQVNAISKMENILMEKGRKENPDNFIGESTVRTAAERSNYLQDLIGQLGEESPVGVITGSMEIWLKQKFKSKEAAAVRAKITSATAEMRNRLSGTAVTDTEARFLEPLIPALNDTPDNFMIKLNELKNAPLQQLNGIRSVYNLPALDEETLLDKSQRVGLYDESKSEYPAGSIFEINGQKYISVGNGHAELLE